MVLKDLEELANNILKHRDDAIEFMRTEKMYTTIAKTESIFAGIQNDPTPVGQKKDLSPAPTSVFENLSWGAAKAFTSKLKEQFPHHLQAADKYVSVLNSMLEGSISTIESFGEKSLADQKTVIDKLYKISSSLTEVNLQHHLDLILKSSKAGFVRKMFIKSYSFIEADEKTTTIKKFIKTVTPKISQIKKEMEECTVDLDYGIVISIVDFAADRGITIDDAEIVDAINRRIILLNGASTNMKVARAQLDAINSNLKNILNTISHLEDVVLPAMKLNG